MIYKSNLIENNPGKISEHNSILFFGINEGLKKLFKKKIKDLNKDKMIIDYHQDDLIGKDNLLINEINNNSLFEEEKIILINNGSDKLFSILELVLEKLESNKIYIFSEPLDKKSKLRNYYEKSKTNLAVACYEDNQINLRNIITKELKNFQNLTPQNISLILESCGTDRIKLYNELNKVILYFVNKRIENEALEKLLNNSVNDEFNILKDAAINGNKSTTNKLLSNTIIEGEKNVLYLAIINQRLIKLSELLNYSEKDRNFESALNKLKPPIFWKDKPVFLSQRKNWDKKKLISALKKTYEVEMFLKTNSNLDKKIILKKLLIDICNLANAA